MAMKNTVIGILAHVDAGKTTLIESMLYTCGNIRSLGRVDKGNTVMDFDEQERERGITIYDSEAMLQWKDHQIFVIDTPGHVDFSAEMERTLQVLDLAIVVVSGLDGVQSHSETIWKCLNHYHIPTILFVNKMDLARREKEALLKDVRTHLSPAIIDWQADNLLDEQSTINEEIMNHFIETGEVDKEMLTEAFLTRQFYPLIFGSALKQDQIDTLLNTIVYFHDEKTYPQAFGAKVYRIDTDEEGNRLTHVKVTGGTLSARDKINENEKADQLRIYTGKKYELVQTAKAGMIVAIKGLVSYEAGMGIGCEEDTKEPLLSANLE